MIFTPSVTSIRRDIASLLVCTICLCHTLVVALLLTGSIDFGMYIFAVNIAHCLLNIRLYLMTS
jgi:hypothetical protein